ncbi:MAG: glycosyl hydrolase family 92 [Bacteroidetes bacterium]|nr:MAG: glycosyl hydrolase family 92 [Bacteroidota bacterium]
MRYRLSTLLLLVLILSSCNHKDVSLTDYVNPFIGTDGHGHTYPGAAVPFGMVQLSPDTRLSGWDGCSAYHYTDSILYGFSHTHLSGTGCSDYGDLLLIPFTGTPTPKKEGKEGFNTPFSHDREKATPGYYEVYLDAMKVRVELTATARTGVHRYHYPAGSSPGILVDLDHRDKVLEAFLTKSGEREISGYRLSEAWAPEQHLYFVMQFSAPIEEVGIWSNDTLIEALTAQGKNLKGYVRFALPESHALTVKVGISAVSIEGARKNLEAEAANKDFDAIRAEAQESWNNELSKVVVSGGSKSEKVVFYTALYHSFLNPNIFMDVDGSFRGTDLKIHQATYDYYTVFSLWDTYRATHPLFTLLETERTNHFIQTFLDMYRYGGKLPMWELAGNYTGCMIGYHAIPVIADAWMKGLRKYDGERALEAMLHSATQEKLGIPAYRKYGFIASEEEHESVSKTLEYAYDDWCIATMAKEMNKEAIYNTYIRRAQSYKNLFDPETGFMRAKDHNRWFSPFDPKEVNFNYTEANCWQYSFYVPQDINRLMDYLGGEEAFCRKLDELFSTNSETTGRDQVDITGLIGQYAHGNEPSHHMAYLYSFAGQPHKTQALCRKIMDKLYDDTPSGLCGNEDCGQMSSWYVFSALGFYPVTPGTDVYVLGSPLFEQATLHLENGNSFTVNARGASAKNKYIKSAKLNGKPLEVIYLTHNDLMAGGELELVMTDTPSTFGVAKEARPVSLLEDNLIVPVPFFSSGDKTFFDETTIALASLDPEAEIHYTLDRREPDASSPLFTAPFSLSKSATIKAVAITPEGARSNVITTSFQKIPQNRSITLYSEYASQYAAGGEAALIDFLHGGADYRTGAWQGYQGQDLRAEVDLGKVTHFSHIETGFLQDQKSWIFLPQRVEYFLSEDGKNFKKVRVINARTTPRKEGVIVEHFRAEGNFKARYVKVVAHSLMENPEWHQSPGGTCWLFADEIIIK